MKNFEGRNLKTVPMDDLTPCTPAELARELALTAAKCIGQGRYDSAAWRLADALALLRGIDDGLPGDARELLDELHGAGFSMTAEAGRLLVRPASKLTDAQRAAVRDAKPQLLALLAEPQGSEPADAAYLLHHFCCAQCLAAGRGYGSRCATGAMLAGVRHD